MARFILRACVVSGLVCSVRARLKGNNNGATKDGDVYQCYAPPMDYGTDCVATKGLIGQEGTTIVYDADPVGDTTLFCYGYGVAYTTGNLYEPCTFEMKDIGAGDSSTTLLWDMNAGAPTIQCEGSPLGSSFTWSYKVGTSSKLSCCGAQFGGGITYDYSKSTCCGSAGVCETLNADCSTCKPSFFVNKTL